MLNANSHENITQHHQHLCNTIALSTVHVLGRRLWTFNENVFIFRITSSALNQIMFRLPQSHVACTNATNRIKHSSTGTTVPKTYCVDFHGCCQHCNLTRHHPHNKPICKDKKNAANIGPALALPTFSWDMSSSDPNPLDMP